MVSVLIKTKVKGMKRLVLFGQFHSPSFGVLSLRRRAAHISEDVISRREYATNTWSKTSRPPRPPSPVLPDDVITFPVALNAISYGMNFFENQMKRLKAG